MAMPVKYKKKGIAGLMRDNKLIRRGLISPAIQSNLGSEEIEHLQDAIRNLKMQIEILQEAMKIIKKEQGINATNLNNREKKQIVDALKEKYELKDLLKFIGLARSSYYYQRRACLSKDSYAEQVEKIEQIFKDNYCCYGYRRIHQELKQQGIRLSEKVIRTIMRQRKLVAASVKKRRYSSYRGEISEAPDNIINRNFKAESGVSGILCLSQFHNVVCFPGKAVRLFHYVPQANCLPEGFAHPIHFILV